MSTPRLTVQQLRPSLASSTSALDRRKALEALSPATSSSILSLSHPAAASSSQSPPLSFIGASSSLLSSARLVAAALQDDPNIFNYDDALELNNTHRSHPFKHAASPTPTVPSAASHSAATATASVRPVSRYIDSLVRAAGERDKQRTLVQHHTRQKEIEREEQMEEFTGKEKFITAPYKLLLQPLPHPPLSTPTTTHLHSQLNRHSQQQRQPQNGTMGSVTSGSSSSGVTHSADRSSEPVNKRRRLQSEEEGETSTTAADDVDNAANSSRQRQQHSSHDSSSDSAIAPTNNPTSNGSGDSEAQEAQKARKRAAARERFLARNKEALQSYSDG